MGPGNVLYGYGVDDETLRSLGATVVEGCLEAGFMVGVRLLVYMRLFAHGCSFFIFTRWGRSNELGHRHAKVYLGKGGGGLVVVWFFLCFFLVLFCVVCVFWCCGFCFLFWLCGLFFLF